MTENQLDISWTPPGPVAAAFMASQRRVQILNGPIGSGKTTACFIKPIRLAAKQQRSPRDGIRRFRLTVIRDTYRQLWRTTIPSWFLRVPRGVGDFTGSENAPATHRLRFQLAPDDFVEFIIDFVAIGENSVEDVMRGYQSTAFYLNEADLLVREVFSYALTRAGRYPEMSDGGPTWSGIIMDCNAPEFATWLYDDVFTKSPAELAALDFDLFRQPSGFSPEAENLGNLPKDYYLNASRGQAEWFTGRMIENKPGFSRDGKPIFPEFNDTLHVARERLDPLPGIPVSGGLDAGLTPAAVIGQRLPNGQRRVLDEITSEPGTGAARFADRLTQLLHERYGAFREIRFWADPSAAYGVDRARGEASWIDIVAARARVRVDAGPTNRLIPRLEAVRRPLTMLIDGKPAFLLSPACATLRAGFNSGYRFRKLAVSGAARWHDEPEKDHHSHPMDALQYWCSADGEDLEIRERRADHDARVSAMRQNFQHDWDPYAR